MDRVAFVAGTERVDLDVGGTRFSTSRATLLDAAPGSRFEQLLSGPGPVFIDRDPTHFRVVLNFLRDGRVVPPPPGSAAREELLREAEYYGLTGLVSLLSASGSSSGPSSGPFSGPSSGPASAQGHQGADSRPCYMCKRALGVAELPAGVCEPCAALNARKRAQTADLAGKVALVTGGRVKIGRAVALKLLRCGATVLVTTRFAAHAAEGFRAEPDYAAFADRLRIYELDLRHLPSVLEFVALLRRELADCGLHVLVNNAAQTIRRPAAYFREPRAATTAEPTVRWSAGGSLLLTGSSPLLALGSAADASDNDSDNDDSALAPEQSDELLFPPGQLDSDGQQLDLRARTSWTLGAAEVSPVEVLEVQLVNCVAPFVLAGQLHVLMARPEGEQAFVVNVSSPEGKFAGMKTAAHPHTNAAKAALNMLTRTSAADFARRRVYMTAVDTGWVSNMTPVPRRAGREPPLTAEDGAARVLDPVFAGLGSSAPVYGVFLQHFVPSEW